MVGNLIEKVIGYKDVAIAQGGVTITGKVVIREGKVYRTEGNVICKWNDQTFSFALNQPDRLVEENTDNYKTPQFSTPGWPSGLSADATVAEFTNFVEKDVE